MSDDPARAIFLEEALGAARAELTAIELVLDMPSEYEPMELARRVAELVAARNRLITVVDEAFGVQPVMTPDELITWLEKKLFEDWSDTGNHYLETKRLRAHVVRLRDLLEHSHRHLGHLFALPGIDAGKLDELTQKITTALAETDPETPR